MYPGRDRLFVAALTFWTHCIIVIIIAVSTTWMPSWTVLRTLPRGIDSKIVLPEFTFNGTVSGAFRTTAASLPGDGWWPFGGRQCDGLDGLGQCDWWNSRSRLIVMREVTKGYWLVMSYSLVTWTVYTDGVVYDIVSVHIGWQWRHLLLLSVVSVADTML